MEDYQPDVPEVILPRIPQEWRISNGIPQGWFDLVSELDAEIAKIAPDYVVLQAKEKFGSLRYYIDGVTREQRAEIDPLIYEAENKSAKVCYLCSNERTHDRFCDDHDRSIA